MNKKIRMSWIRENYERCDPHKLFTSFIVTRMHQNYWLLSLQKNQQESFHIWWTQVHKIASNLQNLQIQYQLSNLATFQLLHRDSYLLKLSKFRNETVVFSNWKYNLSNVIHIGSNVTNVNYSNISNQTLRKYDVHLV